MQQQTADSTATRGCTDVTVSSLLLVLREGQTAQEAVLTLFRRPIPARAYTTLVVLVKSRTCVYVYRFSRNLSVEMKKVSVENNLFVESVEEISAALGCIGRAFL